MRKFEPYIPSSEFLERCVKESVCAGHCCSTMTLSASLNEVGRMIEAMERGEDCWLMDDGTKSRDFIANAKISDDHKDKLIKEFVKIKSMLVRLDIDLEISEDGKRFKSPIDGKFYSRKTTDGRTAGAFYTCKIWNKETGRCTDYENRPNLCRDHNAQKCFLYEDVCTLRKSEGYVAEPIQEIE